MTIDVSSNKVFGRTSSGLSYARQTPFQIRVKLLFRSGQPSAASQAYSKTSRTLSVTPSKMKLAPSTTSLVVFKKLGACFYNGAHNSTTFFRL